MVDLNPGCTPGGGTLVVSPENLGSIRGETVWDHGSEQGGSSLIGQLFLSGYTHIRVNVQGVFTLIYHLVLTSRPFADHKMEKPALDDFCVGRAYDGFCLPEGLRRA